MYGIKWIKMSKTPNISILEQFFLANKKPIKHRGGFNRERFLDRWLQVCTIAMKYFTLDGHSEFFNYHYIYPKLVKKNQQSQRRHIIAIKCVPRGLVTP